MDLRPDSLRTRVLLLATVPLAMMIVVLVVVGHRAAQHTLTANVRESLVNAGHVFSESVRARREALLAQARVTASDPRFFATFSVPSDERDADFARTLALVAEDFLAITDADVLEVYDAEGGRLARRARDDEDDEWSDTAVGRASIAIARNGSLSGDHFAHGRKATMVVDVPVFVAGHLEAVLRMQRHFDAEFAREVAHLTGASVSIRAHGEELARAGEVTVEDLALRPGVRHADEPIEIGEGEVSLDDEDGLHLVLALPGLDVAGGLNAVLSRDLAQQLAPLRVAERVMIVLGFGTLVVTVLAGLGIAVGVTRPLHRVVEAADRLRDGDYEAPLSLEGRDEVARLARSFDAMRTDLRAYVTHLRDVDALKNDFLALAGHELKTPLTIIISFNDLVHSGALGDLPAEIVETNGIIKEQLSRLDRMVQDILDLSSLEARGAEALVLEPCDLAALARETVQAQANARRERTLDVVAPASETTVMVDADERLLARAIRALLDNAVRFTPDEGSVRVEVHADATHAHLSVRDTGMGIEEAQLRWVFGKFYERGDIAHHRSGDLEFGARGIGLGLALTRAIVAAHGGHLDVDSAPGRGSTFVVELPLARRAEHDHRPARLDVPPVPQVLESGS